MLASGIVVGFAHSDDSDPAPITELKEELYYHKVRVDPQGGIVPWFGKSTAEGYDHVIKLVFNFWDTMSRVDTTDSNGAKITVPAYMLHTVWTPDSSDSRGLGGDEIAMAMSSWQLLYAYTGDARVKDNMKYMASTYLDNSLSPANSKWPNLPFPYNTDTKKAIYDGDMISGKGFLQPDKAGSFALELVHLYKMANNDPKIANQKDATDYLNAAIKIATTLTSHIVPGDLQNSPLPFRVNPVSGEIAPLINYTADGKPYVVMLFSKTSNWSGTMQLFLDLEKLDPAHAQNYHKSFSLLLEWMKKYPLKNNDWGPFFEDQGGYSNTQINAVTFARFILEHREYFPNWRSDAKSIFDWTHTVLKNVNPKVKGYGANLVNEQTSYDQPGESHESRQGSTELLYAKLTNDPKASIEAIRLMNWATYMVDFDGKNKFPETPVIDENGHDLTNGSIWMTDGYGDYIRHYLRAMAVDPSLAPSSSTHLISSTSVVQQANYSEKGDLVYRTFDAQGAETVRMTQKPSAVRVDGSPIAERSGRNNFGWTGLKEGGGVLNIVRGQGNQVEINP